MRTKTLLLMAAIALTTVSLKAQTPTVDAVNAAVVDVNSSFFADSQFDIRSGYNSANTQADVGVDYNLTSRFQIGSDFGFSTGSDVLASAQLNAMYRIPVHNLEFDGGLTGGYNWDVQRPYCGVIGRFSYVVSPSTGVTAFVQPQITEVLIRDSKPSIGIVVGVGKAF